MTEQIQKQIKILQTAVNEANAVIIELKNAVSESCKDPEVLTAEQVFNMMLKGNTTAVTSTICYGKTMHHNGRLERDLEYKPFFKTLKKIFIEFELLVIREQKRRPFINSIYHAFKNLKPLNKND